MSTYDFLLALDVPGEAVEAFVNTHADAFFEAFEGEISPYTTGGGAYADCTLEAASLNAAVRRAVAGVEALGLGVRHVEVPAEAFARAA